MTKLTQYVLDQVPEHNATHNMHCYFTGVIITKGGSKCSHNFSKIQTTWFQHTHTDHMGIWSDGDSPSSEVHKLINPKTLQVHFEIIAGQFVGSIGDCSVVKLKKYWFTRNYI